ncbi:PREDICTED: lignin-forming anionic peroxidase-like [Fragaria vesca subsp. vesca]|uniref:lignin-forming anionic peroxidase-like n=1 Tax=Fragaria vesca subsp. vesca TaxID=101020 RepID=UPI0002C35AD5|nr:PREDICTED: lignin-forming anionic peroxidase-like [Fragaria vesca subsp. vesca]
MMKSFSSNVNVASIALLLLLALMSTTSSAQLSSSTFYDNACPNALATIRKSIRSAVSAERRMAASLIRLHFHDCFVQGCDASILLDDTSSITGEKTAPPNLNSVRGYGVIDNAKSEVEKLCPGVVSCADIVAVAARDASVAVGGPDWSVKLGRRDSTTASKSLAGSSLPSFLDSLESLTNRFAGLGLNARDLVALSGAHSIGQAQCFTFRGRIYSNTSDIDANFARTRGRTCPAAANDGDANLAALDLVTPNQLDNNYFKNLIQKKGLLASDQVLFSGGSTDSIVSEYSSKPANFKADFAAAMIKMGDINPLTGSNGQIRRICSALN